jgi:hypothetical protein
MFGAKTQIAAHQKSLGAELLIDDAATGRMRQVRNEQARPSFAHHPHQRGQGGSMADITKITSGTLIAAEKVEGTNVYNLQGDKLGTVDDIMIDKVSGRAIYALMSFGGFLGMGEKYHPLPWSALSTTRARAAMSSTSTRRCSRTRRPTIWKAISSGRRTTAGRSTSTTTRQPIGSLTTAGARGLPHGRPRCS